MSWDRDLCIDAFYNVDEFEAEGLPVETRWNTDCRATGTGWWLDPQGKDFGPNAKYFKHNVAEAKKLLAAAGFANGFDSRPSLHRPPSSLDERRRGDGDRRPAGHRHSVSSEPSTTPSEYIPTFATATASTKAWLPHGDRHHPAASAKRRALTADTGRSPV